MSTLPSNSEFASGFLFRVISEQPATREKLFSIFSGTFIVSFRGRVARPEDVFSRALVYLSTNGLVRHDESLPPVFYVR